MLPSRPLVPVLSRFPKIPRAGPAERAALLGIAALAVGLLIVRLPLEYSLALIAGAVLVGVSVWEPALGMGLAIIFGPGKALLAVTHPEWPSDPGQIFFALAVAGWLARGLAGRRVLVPRIGLLVPLGLYILVGFLSLIPAVSLEEGLKELLKWIEVALGVVVLVSEAERGRAKWLIAAILIAGLVQAAIGLWQFQFRGSGPEPFRILGDHYRAYGTFEQPNPFGGFLGLIWPIPAGLALEGFKRAGSRRSVRSLLAPALWLLASGFLLAALYVSFSRGAWLGAAAAVLVMAVFLPRRLSAGILLVGAALALGWGLARAGLLPASLTARLADAADFTAVAEVRGVNINDANFAIVERLAHWQAAAAMAQAAPWLGVGLGNYSAAYPAFRLLNWPNALGHAHMIYLNILAETGLLGLITYVILWGYIIGLTMRVTSRADGASRGLALGLLGAWAHLSAHHIVDNLYVNNIHLLLAALFALLVHISHQSKDRVF
jgi:O-antigen ligase